MTQVEKAIAIAADVVAIAGSLIGIYFLYEMRDGAAALFPIRATWALELAIIPTCLALGVHRFLGLTSVSGPNDFSGK
ncbi:MAG: hypothetical protein WDN44_07800 [Sphingomonas sp.]